MTAYRVGVLFAVGSLVASAAGHPEVGLFLAIAVLAMLMLALPDERARERHDARRRNRRGR